MATDGGNLDVHGFILTVDDEGPRINCSHCNVRLKHGEQVTVIDNAIYLDEVCKNDLISRLKKLTYSW